MKYYWSGIKLFITLSFFNEAQLVPKMIHQRERWGYSGAAHFGIEEYG
jgi:hypothetical protein